MTFLLRLISASALVGVSIAQLESHTNIRDASSNSEPCAIVSSSSSSFYAATPTPTGSFQVSAEIAFACQRSAPFDQKLSVEQIDYIVPYINFESDLAYLKDPPSTYLMPAVDILGGLKEIRQNASIGAYTSQYAFDAAITDLIGQAHNGHFTYTTRLISAFEYHNDLPLVSISEDGLALPHVYVGTDALKQSKNPGFVPSPVTSINGVDVTLFLGHVEGNGQMGEEAFFQDPDAAYNSMFYSLRSIAGGSNGYFASAGVVTSPTISYTLALQNGTSINVSNFATPTISFDNITSGADLFNTTELKVFQNANLAANPSIALTNGYPKATFQHSQGYVAGYFLDSANYTDTAVLSLLTFDPGTAEWTQEYQFVVQKFLAACTKAGKTKLVIDLSGNTGGDAYLAVDTFKQIFPKVYPYHATQLRATPELNFIGSQLAKAPYNISTYALINYEAFETTTDENFPSWDSLFGPHSIHGDNFTSQALLNFTDPVQTVDTDGIVVTGYLNRSQGFTQPFTADNIVLLFDGNCASACAHFSEMMLVQTQVPGIVFGGRPQYGPMAGVGAVKGFDTLTFSMIQGATALALEIANITGTTVDQGTSLPSINDPPMYPALARINSGNIIRKGDHTMTPTQYLYDAANCRQFWTAENLINATTIWTRAADYRWRNAMCVKPPGPSSGGHLPRPHLLATAVLVSVLFCILAC